VPYLPLPELRNRLQQQGSGGASRSSSSTSGFIAPGDTAPSKEAAR